jgi:oligoribonuclease NrnB/cAMP/cGMP phosphodiesterase (DHH superfamily)
MSNQEDKDWTSISKSKILQPEEIDFVIYHDPCADGTGSAYVIWLLNKLKDSLDKIEFFPTNHGRPPPDIKGKNVLICDFSYSYETIQQMMIDAEKLLIIDHHITAKKELQFIPDEFKIFDMNHSGAMLTWLYVFSTHEPPLFLKYIEDRDIWKKEFNDIDKFAAWWYTLPMDFDIYYKYHDDDLFLKMIENTGSAYQELNKYNIDNSSSFAVPKFCKIGNKFYFVAYLNTTTLKSDIGNKIFDIFPLIDFSAVYSINDKKNCTNFSLRSTNKHTDVSLVAKFLRGGGHRNASGVLVSHVTNILPSTIYDSGHLYKVLKYLYVTPHKFKNIKRIYNLVYCNIPILKWEFGSYILQEKYIGFLNIIHFIFILEKHCTLNKRTCPFIFFSVKKL